MYQIRGTRSDISVVLIGGESVRQSDMTDADQRGGQTSPWNNGQQLRCSMDHRSGPVILIPASDNT